MSQADSFFRDGCGRCEHHATPQCRIHLWPAELALLREIALSTGLSEEQKWGMPCYTDKGKNIFLILALKDYAGVSFFKGSLLTDPKQILESTGPNSEAGRVFRVRSVQDIEQHASALRALMDQAIQVERSGAKVASKSVEDFERPQELIAIFAQDPAFAQAFEALTPGRQKGYLLHFGSAKQSKTRTDRILKHKERILAGQGMHD
jgi:uncharacterized protein YdeI (YjbR/CyaY-like superfamily)